MGKIVCEICGSANIVKQDGVFVCQDCGIKYTADEVKNLLSDATSMLSASSQQTSEDAAPNTVSKEASEAPESLDTPDAASVYSPAQSIRTVSVAHSKQTSDSMAVNAVSSEPSEGSKSSGANIAAVSSPSSAVPRAKTSSAFAVSLNQAAFSLSQIKKLEASDSSLTQANSAGARPGPKYVPPRFKQENIHLMGL